MRPRGAPGPAPASGLRVWRRASGPAAGCHGSGRGRSQAVCCACVAVPDRADETLPEVQDFGERFHNAEEM